MHNFVYQPKLHEPVVKHEKKTYRSLCVFVSRVVKYLKYKYVKYVIKYVACNLYFIHF